MEQHFTILLSFSFLLSLFKQRWLPTGAEAGTHRPHSISQFLSVQMIFFSPLANIDFLSFVSLELCSPRLRSLSLCCCRSSIIARKTLTIMQATYLLLCSQQRKHESTKGSRRKTLWWLIPSLNPPLLRCQQQNLAVVRLQLSRDLCLTLRPTASLQFAGLLCVSIRFTHPS